MIVDAVTQAKAQLSSLIELVLKGEEVIISRAGKPVAVLVAYDSRRRPRNPGALRGHVHIRRLPQYHRDPFDRMLIAQARMENLTLVTNDKIIPKYDVWCLGI